MQNRCLLFLLASLVFFSPLFNSVSSAYDASEVNGLLSGIAQRYIKRATLLYLADKRSEGLLEQALSGFEQKLRKNFMANITGDYRAVILENYDRATASDIKAILAALDEDHLQGAGDIAASISAVEPPQIQAAFLPLLRDLKQKVDFAALHGDEHLVRIKPVLDELFSSVKQMSADADFYALGDALYGQSAPDEIPVWWFDDANYQILDSEHKATNDAGNGDLVDINTATPDELAAIPGIDEDTARAIVAYREADGGFNGLSELLRVNGMDADKFARLRPLVRMVPVRKPPKKWTIMIFINADNDLERFGLVDVNEMEAVGSIADFNVIVQIDRMSAGNRGDSVADGNWDGARRYYIMRDDDPNHLTSPVISELGEVDMGSPDTLADFGKFCIEHYPAQRYMLTVWNHGAGWQGISYDDQASNNLTIIEMMQAIKSISARLHEIQPDKDRIDIVDCDACLMALLEVGYQLRKDVDILVASQLEEPGQGAPYTDYLEKLAEHPGMHAKRFAKILVEDFVLSYCKGGSQSSRRRELTHATKSALKVGSLQALVDKVDELGRFLASNFKLYSRMLVENEKAYGSVRTFNDENVDLYHLAATIGKFRGAPDKVVRLCDDIRRIIAYRRDGVDTVDRPIVIERKTPGYVVWGVNGWKTPPPELFGPNGRLYHSRHVLTPLEPANDGFYRAVLGPFEQLQDPDTGNSELISSVEYQVLFRDGRVGKKLVVKSSKEYRVAKAFPDSSPLLAEAHTRGQGNSHGISIYMPYPLNYSRKYDSLDFSKSTRWDNLIQRVPKYHRSAPVLLTGDRDSFTLERMLTVPGGIRLDRLLNARRFGYNYRKIMSLYAKDGLVISDGLVMKSLGQGAPEPADLEHYLAQGGKLLLICPGQLSANVYAEFFRNSCGLVFAEERKGRVDLRVKGAVTGAFSLGRPNSPMKTSLLRPINGAQPLVAANGGQAAAIGYKSGDGRVVTLGFHLENAPRTAIPVILKKIFDFLGVEFSK